jgi:hypothetical protein
LSSLYDLDARWAGKGDDLSWNGYKVHVTETCDTPDPAPGGRDPDTGSDREQLDGERPNLIAGVATTDATVPDARMTEKIHAALAARDLLPAERVVDSAYPSAALVVDSLARCGITLVSSLLADTSRQARQVPGMTGKLHHRLRLRAGDLPRARAVPGGTRSPSVAPTRS